MEVGGEEEKEVECDLETLRGMLTPRCLWGRGSAGSSLVSLEGH